MNTSGTPHVVHVTSLEKTLWDNLSSRLDATLIRMGMPQLASPTMLILHDLIDTAVRQMHRKLFLALAEDDFGVGLEVHSNYLEELYAAEIAEHGSQNISRYCQQNGYHVSIAFPDSEEVLVEITVPIECTLSKSHSSLLIQALSYQLDIEAVPGERKSTIIRLSRHPGMASPEHLGSLMDDISSLNSMKRIYEQLGYGIIQFSSVGQVLSLSSSLLTGVKLPANEDGMDIFCRAIPYQFYNDIIWGLALADKSGKFENYRIRMRIAGEDYQSVLFNVSGYRDEQGTIHSLWQVVSHVEGESLSEGSIINEARIHKITRNYVPQLVEEKAREAVRLDKDKITNEERSVAILFCDIVGFTSYVESNASSESIVNTLNTILRRVSSSVRRFNGFIDKFMGDSVMAIFYNPAEAVYAALDMQSHSADINALRSRAGQQALRLRIGIHWGEVVIGNVGTAERMDWTAIGDVVNTASRIEKSCNPGSILVSQVLRDAVVPMHHPDLRFGDIFLIQVKGKREALPVCHIHGAEEAGKHQE